MADRLEVDVALLHLGGVRFPVTGPVRYTMTAEDAVELCGLLEPRVAIPIHYEGWRHFHENRDAIERAFAARACCRARSDSLAASRSRGGADSGQWRTVVAFGIDRGAFSRARLTPGIAS